MNPLRTFLSLLVPTGPPTSVNVAVLSDTSLVITWQPPELTERNGIIVQYEIILTELQLDKEQRFSTPADSFSLQVEGTP